jgi:SpoVK/Ycf46/Vps4 family AAA+-type ATPase
VAFLSTILRKIDSFESSDNTLTIFATNRKSSLDAAFLSRMDKIIKFDLPDEHARKQIIKRYAKQLSEE